MAERNEPEPKRTPLDATVATSMPGSGASELVPELARPTLVPGGPMGRYRIGERRGSGTTGEVYLAHDADLGRAVAVKVLNGEASAARFTREARIAGALEHPNIVPVYDLDRTTDGRLCFTMRLIEGQSLGDAIRTNTAPAALVERVHIIRKVCDALAYSHHQGILHQDIKPDNVLVGRFGEVLLVDWGAAASLAEARVGGRVVGTPAYLAPEVARGESASIASDVYSLGATMFHLFTGRYPLWADDDEAFWKRKRAGELDAATAAERRLVPSALLAIAAKCMAPDSAGRYGSAREVAQELDRFLAGLAVTAYRDPLLVRLGRWHRRNARVIWPAVLVLASALAAGLVIYGERLKRMATWGSPVVSEDFSDPDSWRDSWKEIIGGFEVRDGALVSTSNEQSVAYLTTRMEGATAIEYDGTMLPDEPSCDISVMYALEDPLTNKDARTYLLQIGANDNAYAQIMRPDGVRAASNPMMLTPGRTYHVRMEIEGEVLRILIDGQVICEHRELLPVPSGWIGIYAFYKGKAFDNVRVYSKGMPEQVSVLAVADPWCLEGAWDKAAAFYARVAKVHAGKAVGEEALYRQGYALRQGGHGDQARAVWAPIAHGRWGGRIALLGMEDVLDAGRYADVASAIAAAWPGADQDLRPRLVALWTDAVRRATKSYPVDAAGLRALIATRAVTFPDQAREMLAIALNTLGEYDLVLATCADQVAPVSEALIHLGRAEELLTRFPDRHYSVGLAYSVMGRIDELRALRPPSPWMLRLLELDLHCNLTDFEPEAVARIYQQPGRTWEDIARDACRLDRPDEAVRLAQEAKTWPNTEAVSAYLLAGREDELLATYPDWVPVRVAVDYQRAMKEFLAGAPPRTLRIDPGRAYFGNRHLGFMHLVLAPFIAHLAGDQAAAKAGFDRLRSEHRWHFVQAPWYCGEYLAGRIDDAAFLAQPASGNAAPLLLLCKGMRAEMEGHPDAARAAYGAFLALPPHQRCLHIWARDAVAENFAAWRFKALTPPAP